MKQNLFNKLWLRVGMIVAIMTTALSGTAWGATYAGTFSKITSTTAFTTGYYVITASESATTINALGNTVDSNKRMTGQSVTISNNSITNPDNSIVWYITVSGTTVTIKNVNTNTYLYQASTTSGKGMGLKAESVNLTLAGYNSSSPIGFKFTLNGESNNFFKWNNGSKWFANYANDYTTSMTPVCLYKLDEGGTPATNHSLTYSANPAAGGSITVGNNSSSPATVAEGATVSISANPNTGYVFNNWTVSGTGSSVANAGNASTTFTMGTADATLTANFTQVQTYNVTYHANVTGTADIVVEYNEGEDVTVAANTFANSGYVFTKWNTSADGNGINYLPGATIDDINDDIDLYAQWEALTYDFTAIDFTSWTNSYAERTVTYSDATVTFASAGKQNAGSIIDDQPVTKGGDVELKLTDGSTMSKVTFYCTQWTNKAQTITLHYSTDGGTTYDDFDPAVTSSNFTISKDNLPTGTNAVKITFSSTDNQVGIAGVSIEKIVSTVPSITASDVNIAYDATEGSFSYTINNPAQDGSVDIDFDSDGDWLLSATEDNGIVSFTCEANNTNAERLGYVEITYNYGNNESVTKDVWVTQAAAPVIYSTIPALFAKATEVGTTATDVFVTFDSWIVSGVSTNGKSVFVTDNNGKGFVIYYNSDMSSTFAAGNILSGTAVSCKVQLYRGYAEVTNLDASDLTITTGGTVSVANVAMASLAGDNTGALVHYENLTCSVDNSGNTPKYYLSDGTTTLQVYNALYAFEALEADKTYNITGVYQQFDETKEILPRSAADIEEYVAPTHTVSFSVNGNVTSSAEVSEGAAITFPTNPTDINGKTFVGWATETISGTTDTEPTMVTSPTMGNADVTYYAVFATQDSEGGSTTVELTNATIESNAANHGSYSDSYNIDGWTGRYMINNNAGSYSLQLGYNTDSSKGAHNSHLTTPNSDSNITSVTLNTKNNTASGRTFYLCSATNLGCATVNDATYGQGSTTEVNGSVTISVTGNTTQLHIYPNGTAYLESVLVTYSSASYSAYCTTVAAPTESVTVTDAGYATYCSENALDFTNSSIKAYIATADGTTGVTFTKIDKVPAGTGVLLYKDGGATENIPVFDGTGAEDTSDNVFVPGTGAAVASEGTGVKNYILSNGNKGVGFYPASGKTVSVGKAYISVSTETNVKGFIMLPDSDDPTAIEMVNGQSSMVNEIYNLAGQRISKMQKGINIVNGKKIAVK